MLHKIKKHKEFISAINQLDTDTKKWKLLGKGSFGRAYDMGDGRACKITTSEREIKVARRLLNSKKKYSYLYKIINVFVLKKKKKFWCGLIITPKYKKLTDRQKTDLYELFCFLDLSPRFRLRSIKQVRDKITKAASDYYFVHRRMRMGTKAFYSNSWAGKHIAKGDDDRLRDIVEHRMEIFRDYNILHMLRNLKSAKLGPEDMHYENILKNNDQYVLIDIAC